MLKFGFFIAFLIAGTQLSAQLFEQQVWLETGVKYNLNKKFGASMDVTQRYGYMGLETIFPQVSFRYKLKKWVRPSIDYRVVCSKSNSGGYNATHRINGNIQFTHTLKRFDVGFRVRYQYSFKRLNSNYDAEFDQAWRFKPSIQYNIKGQPVSPELSAEFFYNPENSVTGNQFNRIRYYAGADLSLPKNQTIGIGLYLDQWVNDIPKKRIMYSLSYSIGLNNPGKSEAPRNRNPRDL